MGVEWVRFDGEVEHGKVSGKEVRLGFSEG